jgi:hypothetical protein
MTTPTPININSFLQADNYTFANKDIKIEKFDSKDIEEFTDLNLDSVKFVKSEALDALLKASEITDKTDTPSTPSFQPLNEAGILTSGEALNKSLIGALTNNSMGVQEQASTSLEKTNKLAGDIGANLTTEALAKMKEAQETLINGVKSIANGAELANSGIKFAGGNLKFAGNTISMGSDTAVHTTAPIISTVADVENKQSKSIQETTNQKTTIAKSTFTQIEGLQSTVAGNSMKTVTEANITVSNVSSTTAIEKALLNSNNIENVANTLITNRSKQGISNQADTIITNQSPNISITAAEGSKSSIVPKNTIGADSKSGLEFNTDGSYNIAATDASGKTVKFTGINPNNQNIEKWKNIGGLEGQSKDKIAPVQARKGGGNLSILADGSGGTVSIINKNMVMSSTGSLNNTVGGNLNQVAQGSVTMSGAFVNTEADAGLTLSGSGYIRQQSGTTGTMISNGFTFAGYRFPALKKFIDKASNIPLQIREIPALSAIPLVVGISDLRDCLPKKFGSQENPDNTLDQEQKTLNIPDEIAAPTKKEAMQREKPAAIPTGKNIGNASEGLLNKIEGATSTKIDGNTMLSEDSSPTEQTPVPKNKLTSAAVVFKGGSDVYPLEEEETFDLFKRQGSEIIDPDASEETGGPQLTKDLIKAINALSFTNTSIKLNQSKEIPALFTNNILSVQNYLYDKLIKDKTLLINSEKYTTKQKEFIEKTIKLKEAKTLLDRLEQEVVSRSSIGGFMSFVSDTYSKVSSSISIASNLLEDSKKGNIFGTLKTASNLAGTITNDNVFTDLSTIINSSQTLSNVYGQVNSIIQDGNITTAEVIEKLNFQDIQTVVSQGLNTIGIENLEKAESIAKILTGIKKSDGYKKEGLTPKLQEELIIQIVDETGLTNNQARSLYEDAKTVIADVLSGDIKNIVEGSELQNILGFFIGTSNAAILSNIKDIYTKGLNTLNKASNIYNQGQDLFQDGKDLYSTLQSIPALVGIMNAYEIPLLNQVKTVFQCLELINKVQNIVDSIKNVGNSFKKLGQSIEGTFDVFEDLITNDKNPSTLAKLTEGLITGELPITQTINLNTNNSTNIQDNINSEQASIINQTSSDIILNSTPLTKNNCSTVIFSYSANTNDSSNPSEWTENISELDAIDLIEKLPRLTQIYNSIKETPADLPLTLFEELTPAQVEAIKNTEINVVTNNCFLAPQLNLIESTVQVIQIKENVMLYKMSHLEALTLNNKDIFPSNNTVVQIYVSSFFNTKTSLTMDIVRTKEFFTPYIYSFKTTIFDKERNLGIAYLMNSQSRIHLTGINNIPYNYSITDIGNKLTPNIVDAYIVA